MNKIYGTYLWPATLPGETMHISCKYNPGHLAHKECDAKTKTFAKTDFEECKSRVHKELEEIRVMADQLTSTEDQKHVSTEIRNMTEKNSGIMNSEDVQITTNIINELIDFEKESELKEEITNNTFRAFDRIHKSSDAEELARDDTTSSLRDSLDKLANRISDDLAESEEDMSVLEETMGLIVSKKTKNETSFTVYGNRSNLNITGFQTGYSGHDDNVLFSVTAPANNKKTPVTAIVYDSPKFYPDNVTVKDITTTLAQKFVTRAYSQYAVTKIVSLVTEIKYAHTTDTIDFAPHQAIKMNFSVKEEKPQVHYKMALNTNYECVYYNTDIKLWINGAKSGCITEVEGKIGETRYVSCQCAHMTSFAVLMSFDCNYDPMEGTLTTILLAVSLLCLTLTILAYLPAKEMLRTVPVRINLFFFTSLILSMITFYIMEYIVTNSVMNNIVPSEADSASSPCLAIAFLMNYFWLCQLAWMVCESVMMHRALVSNVFDSLIQRYILKLNLSCWGIPLIPPIIGIIWSKSDFANPKTCFLRKKYGLVTFYGPVILGILFNAFNFIRIAWSLFRADSVIDRNVSEMEKTKRRLKTAIKIMTLLGISWMFGFFLIINETNVIWLRWLFIVFNSTQGIFIFILYPVLNEDLRKLWKNKLSNSGSTVITHNRIPAARMREPCSTRGTDEIEMEHLNPE